MNKLINDDCMNFLKANKELKYGAIITDIPYGITSNSRDVFPTKEFFKLI